MLLVERGEPALDPGSIAGPGRNRFRESPPILAPAARAFLGDKPVFSHWKLPGRQLKDLPPLLLPKLACTPSWSTLPPALPCRGSWSRIRSGSATSSSVAPR